MSVHILAEEARGKCLVSTSITLLPYSLVTGSLVNMDVVIFWLSWLVYKPQQSSCLDTPLPEHWAYRCMCDARFCIGLGI